MVFDNTFNNISVIS